MTLGRAVGLLSLVGLIASGGVSCGSDSSGPTSATATTTRTPRVVTQGSFALQAPTEDTVFFGLVPVTESAAGTWEATVEWTFATNTLWMYVANGSCTAAQFASDDCPDTAACQCQFAVRSEVATPKPRVLTIPNAAGGTRTLIVMNLGPREETGNYTIRLTPSSTTSGTDGDSSSVRATGAAQIVTARKTRR